VGGNRTRRCDTSQMPQNTPPPASSQRDPLELYNTQRERVAWLLEQPGVRSVEILDIALITGSVQLTVLIRRAHRRAQQAVIAPSGRIHRLP
jgi:hypothetical protein